MKRVSLITGGVRGIGLGISQFLADEGHNLAISGRRPETQVRDTLLTLRKTDVEVLYIQADVASKDDRYRLLEKIEEHFGCLNVLVNNAGMAPENRADILEASEESFDRVMAVNLKGPYFLTQASARWMIRQKQADSNFEGCVINISSISATVASPSRGDYCVSKAGLSMATKLWAARLGEFSIPVFEVRPGVVMTDMTAAVKERYDKLIEEGLTIQGRWGLPEDVGRAVAMLVRGDLTYSTGQVVMVDGGLMVHRL
jgi:NAD(P)-dependent dehydrogenase (short-subunit alcohol dehydrogenase family)